MLLRLTLITASTCLLKLLFFSIFALDIGCLTHAAYMSVEPKRLIRVRISIAAKQRLTDNLVHFPLACLIFIWCPRWTLIFAPAFRVAFSDFLFRSFPAASLGSCGGRALSLVFGELALN